MSFSFEMYENAVLAKIDGEVDMNIAPLWRDELDRVLTKSYARNLVFDFYQVSFIDSSGLGVLLGRYKRVSARGGRVRVIGANPRVYRILVMSGLARLMDIEEQSTGAKGGKVS